MSRFLGIVSILAVVLLAMAFAAANAGNRVTLELGIITLFRVPVTLVAFSGLLAGMLVMFATGVYSDLKVRHILRERLAQEVQEEQRWIDGNQRDLFAPDPEGGEEGPTDRLAEEPSLESAEEPSLEPAEEPTLEPAEEPTLEPAEEPSREPVEERFSVLPAPEPPELPTMGGEELENEELVTDETVEENPKE